MHIIFTISRCIFVVLYIQFFCESRHSVRIKYTQFSVEFSQFWIFKFSTIPDISYILCVQFTVQFMQFRSFNFSANPDILYIQCIQFPAEFSQFWIFDYFANTDIPHILCTQFLIQLTQFWTLNFSTHPVMQYIYTVHNFSLNIRISGYSIFLLIQTFCTNNVHNFPLNFNNSRY